MTDKDTQDCVLCEYFHITWDRDFPKGCKLFGFKSKHAPSIMVREATGAPCKNFMENSKRKLNRKTK